MISLIQMEMKGVTKFFPAGEVSVQSLIAGNDLLLLPEDVPGSIKKIRKAIRKKQIDKNDFHERVKKVLHAKYNAGLNQARVISTEGLVDSLNTGTRELKRRIAENAITLVKCTDNGSLPLALGKRIAYLGVGIDTANMFATSLQQNYNADLYFFNYKQDAIAIGNLVTTLREKADIVIIGIHSYSRRPANNFGISRAAYQLIQQVQTGMPTITCAFGNPYALKNIAATSAALVACYEDDEITQTAAADLLSGKLPA